MSSYKRRPYREPLSLRASSLKYECSSSSTSTQSSEPPGAAAKPSIETDNE